MSITETPKKRGRPATGRDPTYTVRLSDETVARIDAWAAARGVNRAEAIRAMIEATLKLGGLD
jgi:predicted DNA-binding protein